MEVLEPEETKRLREHIAELEKQLESIAVVYAKKCEDGEGSYYEVGSIVTDDFEEAVSLIPKAITDREADLAKHGGHTAECSFHDGGYWAKDNWIRYPKCDCGWAKLEKHRSKP